jgi:5-methylcytosine-specific restriction endonuclease McrA
MASGDGAAARLRARVKRGGGDVCASCGEFFPDPLIEIDHPVRLFDGGEDIDSNVVSMCKRCHGAKTARENRRENRR